MSDPVSNRDEFLRHYGAGQDALLYSRFSGDTITPVAAYLKLQSLSRHLFLLESVEQGKNRARYSFLGWDPLLLWECRGDTAFRRQGDHDSWHPVADRKPLDDLTKLLQEILIPFPDHLSAAASGLFGFLSYDAVHYIEHIPPHINGDAPDLPDGRYFLPRQLLIFDNVNDHVILAVRCRHDPTVDAETAFRNSLSVIHTSLQHLEQPIAHHLPIPRADDEANLPTPQQLTAPAAYQQAVDRARDYIKNGDIFQVVLSQVFRYQHFHHHPFSFYRALRAANPAPYMFFFQWEDFAFAGASPETLVKVVDGTVSVYPIAGTRPRGATTLDDAKLERDLKSDPKERAEHLMLLDLGRNDVGKVARVGSVKVVKEFEVERYSFVMHLVSEVIGRLRPDRSSLDALLAGLPAGTVSGAPKIRAMEIISELEKRKRGLYAGAVGYFSARLPDQGDEPHDHHAVNQADMDHCIALRTALLIADQVIIQTGAGIVYDSDPAKEQEECLNKARALFRAFARTAEFSGN